MPVEHRRRAKVMRLLRNGQITITEAAQIAIVSRQRVRLWCKNTAIDPVKARTDWIAGIIQSLDRKGR
jgi:hypothetical protein